MLIWINGPFGGGKTQTAHELHRRLPGSVVCDPEQVGFGLHRMMPRGLREDFQDFPAWRHGVREVLDRTLRAHTGVVLAPMTVIDAGYLREILGPLRDAGHDVRHVSLLAERPTVLRRLRTRSFGPLAQVVAGRDVLPRWESFAVQKLDLCLERLQLPEFAEHLWTDHLTVPQAADHVAAGARLSLLPNDDGCLRGYARRAWTSLRHIRFV